MESASKVYMGVALMITYAFAMVVSDSLAKELSSAQSVIVVVWYRYAFHTICLSIIAALHYAKYREPQSIGSHKIQLLRGTVLVLSSIAFFYSIADMPLAEALSLLYIFPLVAVILSIIFLKEKITSVQGVLIILGFIGVILILNPSTAINMNAGAYALIAGVLMGIYMLLTKTMTKGASPILSSLYSGLIGIVCIPFFPGFEWTLFQSYSLTMGIIMGVLAAMGHYCMFISMTHAPASIVSPFAFSEILFATIIGAWWFGDILSPITFLGVGMIVLSGILFAVHSNQKSI